MSNTAPNLDSVKLSAAARATSEDRVAAEEQRRKQAEWATVVLQTVQSEFRSHGFASPAGAQTKSGDAPLAVTSEEVDAQGEHTGDRSVKDLSNAASSRRAPGPERLTFEVDGGQLGIVKLSIGRENGAVRVVIGIEDARQRALVGLEQEQLVAALRSAGVRVASVSVQSPDAPGTAFAQSRRVMNPQPLNPAAAYRGPKRSEDLDADSGLNLVG